MPASLRMEVFPFDMERALAFYRHILGFTVVRIESDASYAYLQRDSVFIGMVPQDKIPGVATSQPHRRPPTGVEIVLEVDDLDQERDRIVGGGGKLESDITLQPWGLRDCRLVDPDGYYWRITEHGSGGRGREHS